MQYTKTQGLLLSLVVSTVYVGSFRLWKPAAVEGRDRDDPVVIRHRLQRISVLCGILVLVVPYVLAQVYGIGSFGANLVRLFSDGGSTSRAVRDMVGSGGLMGVLYMGPIFEYLTDIDVEDLIYDFKTELCTLQGFRDHVFAPFTEELVYRAIVYQLLQPIASDKKIMLLLPILFGVAHIHHAYELYRTKDLPASIVAFDALVKTTYTTIFGILANYIYFIKFESTNLGASTLIHTICNLIGFPTIILSQRSYLVNILYYLLIITGILGFYHLL